MSGVVLLSDDEADIGAYQASRDFWRSVCLAEAEWLILASSLTASMVPAWGILESCRGHWVNFSDRPDRWLPLHKNAWMRVEALVKWAGEPSPKSETVDAGYAQFVASFWRALAEERARMAMLLAASAQQDACLLRLVHAGCGRPDQDADLYARAREAYDRYHAAAAYCGWAGEP